MQATADVKNRFARMAAAAAWGLNQWSAMEEYVNFIPKESQDGSFFRSVLAIHRCFRINTRHYRTTKTNFFLKQRAI